MTSGLTAFLLYRSGAFTVLDAIKNGTCAGAVMADADANHALGMGDVSGAFFSQSSYRAEPPARLLTLLEIRKKLSAAVPLRSERLTGCSADVSSQGGLIWLSEGCTASCTPYPLPHNPPSYRRALLQSHCDGGRPQHGLLRTRFQQEPQHK